MLIFVIHGQLNVLVVYLELGDQTSHQLIQTFFFNINIYIYIYIVLIIFMHKFSNFYIFFDFSEVLTSKILNYLIARLNNNFFVKL